MSAISEKSNMQAKMDGTTEEGEKVIIDLKGFFRNENRYQEKINTLARP
jgi:hypothetical protein